MKLNIENPGLQGENRVLLHGDDDLTANSIWHKAGFTIAPLFSSSEFITFQANINSIFIKTLEKAAIKIPEHFQAENYHELVQEQPEKHLEVLKHSKRFQIVDFPFPLEDFISRISNLIKTPLTVQNPHTGFCLFHLRIIRPGKQDFNPLHRDVWIDRLRDGINLYIPVFGSNAQSSLGIVPGSHLWNDSEVERTVGGAVVNGIQFSVPALKSATKPVEIIRPNPTQGEVLVFSPYLLHGGAPNQSTITRMSVEMRLWRAPQ